MALATTTIELPLDGSWHTIELAGSDCWVQMLGDGPVIAVVAGTTAPSTSEKGIVFSRGGLTMFPFEGITSSERIYLRAKNVGDSELVVLLGDVA